MFLNIVFGAEKSNLTIDELKKQIASAIKRQRISVNLAKADVQMVKQLAKTYDIPARVVTEVRHIWRAPFLAPSSIDDATRRALVSELAGLEVEEIYVD